MKFKKIQSLGFTIILLVTMTSCNPLFGVGSFLHAVVTGNTTAQVIGATDIVIEKQTGKSVKEHVWHHIKKKNQQ